MAASSTSPNTPMSQNTWYIVQQPEGYCDIEATPPSGKLPSWGPFESQADAIARRVGLIRTGKCQPR